ncbi:amidase family protein [Sorangium sp. So ce1128]
MGGVLTGSLLRHGSTSSRVSLLDECSGSARGRCADVPTVARRPSRTAAAGPGPGEAHAPRSACACVRASALRACARAPPLPVPPRCAHPRRTWSPAVRGRDQPHARFIRAGWHAARAEGKGLGALAPCPVPCNGPASAVRRARREGCGRNQLPALDYRIPLDNGVRGLRIAWSPRLGYVRTRDKDVEDLAARAARVFEELGATVEEADPGFEDPLEIIRTLWRTGSWSELRAVPEERWSEMDPGFVETAAMGRDISAADFFASVNGRAALFATMAQFHARYDLLLTPSVAVAPFEVGRNTPADGRSGDDWMNWAPYSYPFDLTLQPAATVPCGLTASGLPAGLQIVGPFLRDDLVLQAARAFEGIRPWPVIVEPRVRH